MNESITELTPAPAAPDRTIAPPAGSSSRSARGLRRAALFILLLVGLVVALDFLIDSGLRRITTSSFGAMNRLMQGQVQADVVISGSSRALVHYDPRILEARTGLTAFNLGRNGSHIDMQLALLESYLRHNRKPRLVLHNLDLHSLSVSAELYDPAQYAPYLREEPIYAAIRRVQPDAWKWRYLPLYAYLVPDLRLTWLLGVRRLAGFEPPEDHFQGFMPRMLRWSGDFESFRRRHPEGFSTPVQAEGIQSLEALLSLCRTHALPVVLVYSPEYAEIQPLQSNRGAIFEQFREIADRFNVPLWDYSESPLSRVRDYFYNSQHLNASGAAAFSADLASRMSHYLDVTGTTLRATASTSGPIATEPDGRL